jgi:hypothetical protein
MAIMKKYLGILSLSLAAVTTSAQGFVNFANTPSTLISAPNYSLGVVLPMSGPPGSYYFGLFLGQTWPGTPTFTGIYATNTGVDGLFSGGVVAVPGWAAGAFTNFFVAGWSGDKGHDFQTEWLHDGSYYVADGRSSVGIGIAGNGTTIPPLELFRPQGFLYGFGVYPLAPEPSTAAITTVGAAIVLIARRCRKLRSPALRQL